MKKSELANIILAETEGFETGHVSSFNQQVLSSLKTAAFTGEVDDKDKETLKGLLKTFLNETWPEESEAHKYVIGSCLAQALLFEEPMHPQEKVSYITRIENGKKRYYCPYNEKGTLCDFCAAVSIEDLKNQWKDQIEQIRKEYGPEEAFVQKVILETGFQEAGIIPVEKLSFHEEVRKICEDNQCRCYGTTWACPPAVGSLEDCKNRVLGFRYLHLFSKAYAVEDFLDMERMLKSMKDFKIAARELDWKLRGRFSSMMILSNESCDRCKECTYPDAPCRFSEDLHHSIEGYGFYVSELAKQAGIKYMNGANTITYFGAVLYS